MSAWYTNLLLNPPAGTCPGSLSQPSLTYGVAMLRPDRMTIWLAGAGPRVGPARSGRAGPLRHRPRNKFGSSRRGSGRSWSTIASSATGRASRRRGCGSTRGPRCWPGATRGRRSCRASRRRACSSRRSVTRTTTSRCRPRRSCRRRADRRPDPVGRDGRPLARSETPAPAPAPAARREFQITDKDRAHWAFQPVERPPVPRSRTAPGSRNPIDAFILARLEAKGLAPNPPAAKHELIRRALLRPDRPAADARRGRRVPGRRLARRLRDAGRPPARLAALRREVGPALARPRPLRRDQQLRARQPQAERLALPRLRHPRLQRRQALRPLRPRATGRRRAAGRRHRRPDRHRLLPPGHLGRRADRPRAGPLRRPRRHRRHDRPGLPRPDGRLRPLPRPQDRPDPAEGLLPAALVLPQHQPLPQRRPDRRGADRLRSPTSRRAFEQRRSANASTSCKALRERDRRDRGRVPRAATGRIRRRARPESRRQRAVGRARSGSEGSAAARRSERFAALRASCSRELRARSSGQGRRRAPPCASPRPGPRLPTTFVLLRGNPHVPGDQVEPGFPDVLGSPSPSIPDASPRARRRRGRRRVLADWIASPDNPLTARVMANRLWQHHFGRGIVRSPSNFGLQGDKPTHPELLDWLAAEFVAQGWRLKPLHRLILTSNAYRMSSRGERRGAGQGSDQRPLLAVRHAAADGRGDPRLDPRRQRHAEPRRCTGRASTPRSRRGAGRPVDAGQRLGQVAPEEQARRSIYIHVKRSLLDADPRKLRRRRDRPLVPGPVQHDPADPGAGDAQRRLPEPAGRGVRRPAPPRGRRRPRCQQVRLALALATGREPPAAEVRRGVDLIDGIRGSRRSRRRGRRIESFCLVVLNLNDFVYLD